MADCICRGLGTNLHRADCPMVLAVIDRKLGGELDRRTRTAGPFSWYKVAAKWDEEETCARRAAVCLLFLNVHDVITDSERRKALARLKKLMAKEADHG